MWCVLYRSFRSFQSLHSLYLFFDWDNLMTPLNLYPKEITRVIFFESIATFGSFHLIYLFLSPNKKKPGCARKTRVYVCVGPATFSRSSYLQCILLARPLFSKENDCKKRKNPGFLSVLVQKVEKKWTFWPKNWTFERKNLRKCELQIKKLNKNSQKLNISLRFISKI